MAPRAFEMFVHIWMATKRDLLIWILSGVGVIATLERVVANRRETNPPADKTEFHVVKRPSWSFRIVFAGGYLLFSGLCVIPSLLFRAHYFVVVLPAVAMFFSVGCLSSEVWLEDSLIVRAIRKWWNSSSPHLSDFSNSHATVQFPDLEVIAGDSPAAKTISHVAAQSPQVPMRIAIFGFALMVSIVIEKNYLFFTPMTQLCREIYGSNPFAESPVIAKYLKEQTSSTDRIAVLGSEPQILFLSGRRSCSGYIYMYPLMENQKFARRMQQEMIRDLESSMPSYIVDVDIRFSWLWSNIGQSFVEWKQAFLSEHYQCVGLCLITTGESVFRFEKKIRRMPPTSQDFIAVYRLKKKFDE